MKQESTQKYLDISAIKDNTIIMKDGSLRAVLVVSSTNFALKSEEEQNAVVDAYQNFLNSLDFHIQILMHSRILDINRYLIKLKDLSMVQTNELLRIQTNDYIEYVGKLVQYANIMSKTFYAIVPYSTEQGKEGMMSKIKKVFNPITDITLSEQGFETGKARLLERVAHVSAGLGGAGLRSIMLNTAELLQLLYQSYNFENASAIHGEEVSELEVVLPK